MAPGATYYWRVDVVGFAATNSGVVWSFSPATISVNPSLLNLSAIAGFNPASVSISVTGSTYVAWTAAVTGQNWMSVSPLERHDTFCTVNVSFNTAALSAGIYTNNIEFTASGLKLEVPVTLTVKALNITKMATDFQRPYIYVPGTELPALSGQSGYVLFINTASGNLDNAVPVGINPTDLTINCGGEEKTLMSRVGLKPSTPVIDLNSQALLPSLHLGTDVYKINAGKPGQLIFEGEDQWVTASLINTTDGSTITSALFREGDSDLNPRTALLLSRG